MKASEAEPLAAFLMKCLTWYPERRATAQELLDDPWLTMPKNFDTKMTDEQYEEMMSKVKEIDQKKKLAEALKGEKNDDEKELLMPDVDDHGQPCASAVAKACLENDPSPTRVFEEQLLGRSGLIQTSG